MGKERVGFIGLGNMGKPMAGSLLAKGFALVAHDAMAERTAILAQRGATPAASIAEVVAASDVVVTMLPNTPDVEVVFGEMMRGGRAGQMHMDMSTIDPLASRRFAAALAGKGIGWVDAGVGRSPAHAERGESLFMVGGTEPDLARAMPLLEAMGNKVIRCGGPGAGITMKIVLNFLSMATCQLTAEALTLGGKLAGVPVFTGAAARECLSQARNAQGLGGKDITAVLVAAATNAGTKPPRL
jgi:4-hydroxybutyrate dehydrogenase/sulfolactaldehyde 3-reductase